MNTIKVTQGKDRGRKGFRRLSASRACCMCCHAASCAERTVRDCRAQGWGRQWEESCSSCGGYNQYYYGELSASLERSWKYNAGCYPYYWTQAKPHLL